MRSQPEKLAPRGAGPLAWLRLLVGAFCAGVGALAVVPAPAGLFWYVGLGATELGHWIALPALATLLPGWRLSWQGRVGAALGVVGAGLTLSALARALTFAGQVQAQVGDAVGAVEPLTRPDAPARPAPLVPLDLYRGIASPPVNVHTVTFANPDGQELKMDVYRAETVSRNGPSPCVVMVHGGSWQNGGRADLPQLNTYLAARGYVVAAIDYRMAPKWRFPAETDDLHSAIAHLKANATDFGLDHTRIAILGRSAGAQMALLAAYTPPDPAIRGVVSLYGPTDMIYGYTHPANPAVLDSKAVLEAYLGGSPASVPTTYHDASPINFVGPKTPSTLLIHGDRDALVSPMQSILLAEKLAAGGRPYLHLRLPWADHGCDFYPSGPCGQIVTYSVERFLASVFKQP